MKSSSFIIAPHFCVISGTWTSLAFSASYIGYDLLAFLVENGTISMASPDFCVCCVAGRQKRVVLKLPLLPLSASYWSEAPGLPVPLL